MGSVQGLKRVVEDEAQEQKALEPQERKQPFYTSSLFLVRLAVGIILAMVVASYIFF